MAGRRKRGQPPAYLHHKATGQAYVNIGKIVYLGPYGSSESRSKYRQIVDQWEKESQPLPPKSGCTIAELIAAHAQHAKIYYRRSDGSLTSEVRSFTMSLAPLLGKDYRDMPASEFRPSHLKDIRKKWIESGLCRNTINQHVGRVRRLFRFGVGEELIPEMVAAALSMVKDLAPGRSEAHDHEPVSPAPLKDVEAVLRVVHPILQAMIQIQLLAGPRPGEVCAMKGEEIDQEGIVKIGSRRVKLPGGVWVFQPTQHKAKHKGKVVAYILSERAQKVLAPFMAPGYLFSAAKVMEDHRARRKSKARTTKPYRRKLNPVIKPGARWSSSGYQHAILKACRKIGVPEWTPLQLRHNFLSTLDEAAGIQIASHAVGHSSLSTTEIYVEKNLQAVAFALLQLDAQDKS